MPGLAYIRAFIASRIFRREMSYSLQSRNVLFCLIAAGVHGSLGVPVKRRRALLASNPIKE
jgi:hypothetical protein